MTDPRKGFPETVHILSTLSKAKAFPIRWKEMTNLIQEVTFKGGKKETVVWNVETGVGDGIMLRSPCIWPQGKSSLKKLEAGKISLYTDYEGLKREVALSRASIKPFLALRGPIEANALKWDASKASLLLFSDGNVDSEPIGAMVTNGTTVTVEISGFDLKRPVKARVGFLAATYTAKPKKS